MTNQNIIDSLKRSPLFSISLCSKELSHSNFWAWLIKEISINGKNPFVEVFYPDFYTNNYLFESVAREENHIDVKIKYKDDVGIDKCLLIENKIKSVPSYKQLKKYQIDTKDFNHGILTGIKSTLDLPDNEWEFLSYEKIAERINNINERIKNNLDQFTYESIKHYCNDISNISNLIEGELCKNTNNYIISPDDSIAELRFGDVLLKLNAALFAEEIKKRIKNDENELRSTKFGLPKVESSYNNKSSTITVVYKEPLEDGREVDDDDWNYKHEKGRIGIQIQGCQFRIYAGPSDSNSRYKKNRDLLKSDLTSLGWFEDYNNQQIRNRKSNMSKNKEYCKYEIESGYLHVYQYWTITNTSYDSLYSEIKKELLRAKNLIDSGEVHF